MSNDIAAKPPKVELAERRLMTKAQLTELGDFLHGPGACNFHESTGVGIDAVRGAPKGELLWVCEAHTYRLTEPWLKRHQLDAEFNLAMLHFLGGHCDCEIVFNVWPANWPARGRLELDRARRILDLYRDATLELTEDDLAYLSGLKPD